MGESRDLAGAATVVAAVRDALPDVEPIAPPTRMPKGYSSESWRVATDAGELVVKIRRQMTDAAKLRGMAEAARLASAAGVPTPEVLYAGLAATVDGRPVVIQRYIAGLDAEAALPGLDDAQRARLFSDFGAAVGRLHRIGLPRFTERIGAPESAVDDWATVVRRVAERYAAWNREVGVLAAPEIEAIRDRLIRDAAAVSPVVSPALTHRDLYLANVLVRDGRLAALLDFELAKGYDPLQDFMKLGAWVFESWPESIEPFMAAYRQGVSRIPRAEQRLAVCLALGHFVSVPNWVQFGAEQLTRDSRDWLRDWLRGSYPWWVRRIVAALTEGRNEK